jgi:dynein heavy chain
MVSAIQTYIQEAMGQKYIEPPTFDLSLSYEDSNSASPLIFVLSPGADPMAGLFRFAEEKGLYFDSVRSVGYSVLLVLYIIIIIIIIIIKELV